MPSVVVCSKCGRPLDAHVLNLDHFVDCARCGSSLQVLVFPALFQRQTPAHAERLGGDTEASCFYHAENRAVTPCDSCGRFICGICRLDVSGQNVCPSCIESGIRTRKLIGFESRRTLYDTIALAMATLPLLMVWPSVLTAPAAIYVSIRYWRAPSSLVRRTKFRFILAIVIALTQIALWGLVAILLLGRWRPR